MAEDKDLLFINSQVDSSVPVTYVEEELIYLLGELSLMDMIENDQLFEQYLIEYCQVMARTKQTQRGGSSMGTRTSAGGKPLAFQSPRRSPRFSGYLDSDSSLDAAANLFGVNAMMSGDPRRSPRKRGNLGNLPGFSSDDSQGSTMSTRAKKRKQDDDDDANQNEPKAGTSGGGSGDGAAKTVPKKNAKKKKPTMKELAIGWNQMARLGLACETTRG